MAPTRAALGLTGLRRKARVQQKLEKLSTADTIRAITFAEVVLLVMDATHPF